VTGRRSVRERGRIGAAILPGGLAALEVLKEPWPVLFCLANEDRVGVFLRFIRQQGYMRASENDSNSFVAEAVGDSVRMRSTGCVKGDGDEIDGRAEINGLDGFIHVAHNPVCRDKGSEIGHRDLLKVEEAGAPNALNLRRRSGDEKKRGTCAG